MVEPLGGGLFRVLGTVEVRAGEAWTSVNAAKWRALLAMLLLHPGQPVSSDRLIAALWDEDPPRRALNLLSVYVHQLRKLIGEDGSKILITRAPGYQVVLAPGDLDAEVFAARLGQARMAMAAGDPAGAAGLLTEALTLWRGPALDDVESTPPVAAGKSRLEESRIEAERLRAQAELACGRPAAVVAHMRELLTTYPLREEIWALLIQALLADGRQAEALAACGQAREKIAGELGVDPGPELQQLYQQILTADTNTAGGGASSGMVSASYPQHQLPADITDFTGRSDQVEQVRRLLSEDGGEGSPGAVRVVVVMGSGGLGKTTLAVHAAHLLAGQFPDGQLYANLLGTTHPAAPGDILARFLRDLGMDGSRVPLNTEERATHFRSRLADRRMLIVLDDARDAAQVLPLLPGSASAAVLVTSRNRLPELMGSQVIDLEVLRLDEARALFTGMVGERRVAAESEAASDVLAACAGLPLAIRIVGARLAARANWAVQTLAERLADERHRLDEMRVGNLAVRASFEVSFASLAGAPPGGVDPARAFRLLGVWTGPSISLSAAAALLGSPKDAVADALDVLVDAHLLESPRYEEYRFHDLLRVYAADRVHTEEGEEERYAAIGRVLNWYLYTAEAACQVISPQRRRVPLGPPPELVHPLEFDSLDDALNWCETNKLGLLEGTRLAATNGLHEIGWKLPAAAMSFYYRRSHWADWLTTHDIGLASTRALGDRAAEAWMLNNLGICYGVQHLPEAVDYFEQALDIHRDLLDSPDARGQALVANNLATAYFDLHRYTEALSAAQRSLTIQRQAGDRYLEGIMLGVLGGSYRELGRFPEAIEHLLQALEIFRKLGLLDEEADSLSDLGDTYFRLGQLDKAIGRFQDSLAILQATGNTRGEAATLRRLGAALNRAGRSGQARGRLNEALLLFRNLGDHTQEAQVRADLAKIT
jgi:DNA-binding SARP family transcriptional activator/tetratricopeptide (TPR) repeat protein